MTDDFKSKTEKNRLIPRVFVAAMCFGIVGLFTWQFSKRSQLRNEIQKIDEAHKNLSDEIVAKQAVIHEVPRLEREEEHLQIELVKMFSMYDSPEFLDDLPENPFPTGAQSVKDSETFFVHWGRRNNKHGSSMAGVVYVPQNRLARLVFFFDQKTQPRRRSKVDETGEPKPLPKPLDREFKFELNEKGWVKFRIETNNVDDGCEVVMNCGDQPEQVVRIPDLESRGGGGYGRRSELIRIGERRQIGWIYKQGKGSVNLPEIPEALKDNWLILYPQNFRLRAKGAKGYDGSQQIDVYVSLESDLNLQTDFKVEE